jgi:hypothetical protein
LHDNPHIDTILLSYQFSSLNYDLERRWLFNEPNLLESVSALLPYMEPGDAQAFLTEHNFYKAVAIVPKVALQHHFDQSHGEQDKWVRKHIGHFLPLSYSKVKQDTASRVPYDKLSQKDTVSMMQLRYLRKISDYCKSRNKTLILINTPVFESRKYTSYIAFENNRKKYFNDELFLDYSQMQLPDSLFADVAHLNKKGAAVFSKYLSQNLNRDVASARHGTFTFPYIQLHQ